MKLTEQKLRRLIRQVMSEGCGDAPIHRTLAGHDVPFGCPDCVEDIGLRIGDASFSRDRASRGSAERSNYNGLLAVLRKALRAALKELEAAESDNFDVVEL